MSGVPFAPRPWDEIIPGLYQGGHDYRPTLADPVMDVIVRDEFDLVVSLYRRRNADHGPAEGVRHIGVSMLDSAIAPYEIETVRNLADHIALEVAAGRKVLVRCQAGYNRSGLVVAYALLRMGYTADQAIELIRVKRSPHALCNEHFVRYIQGEVSRG